MQRDWDTIKSILTKIEAETDGTNVVAFSRKNDDESKKILYHLELIIDEKLVVVQTVSDGGIRVQRLTNKGHDFLANSRNDTAWNKAKKTAQNTSFQIFSSILSELVAVTVRAAISI